MLPSELVIGKKYYYYPEDDKHLEFEIILMYEGVREMDNKINNYKFYDEGIKKGILLDKDEVLELLPYKF